MLVLQEIVEDVDGGLTRGEHVSDEVSRAALYGHEKARRIRRLDLRHQQVQSSMNYV